MRRDLLSRLSPDRFWQDPDNWPPVADELIKPELRSLYQQRKQAVIKYCRCEWTLKTIEEKFGFKRKDFLRLVRRCFTPTRNGEIVGFAALIPFRRVKKTKGKLRNLFDRHPELEEYVMNSFFGKKVKKEGELPEHQKPVLDLHRSFLKKCREFGVGDGVFPFNTKSQGREPFRKYLNSLYHDNDVQGAAYREGDVARRNLIATDLTFGSEVKALRPYEVVQADAHRIHAIVVILVEDIYGIVTPLLLERPWVIFLIDCFSRAILGYYFSLSLEPSSNDLLECVARALIPWEPKHLTIEGIEYPEGGGLPSGVLAHCAWRAFDRLELDNAMAHISPWAQDRINHVVHCCINPGKSGQPESRAIIERFFRTLESRGCHRLPSTTGSHPRDSRRQDPEEKAKKFKITLSEVEQLLDVIVARYNTTSSKSLFGNTPLGYISRCDEQRPFFVRTVLHEHRRSLPLFYRYYKVTVRGGKNGRRPYIQFKHAIYQNEVLVASSSICGTTITLEVNTKDLSSIRAYLPDGSTLGMLLAQGCWALKPHSLKTREAICRLINDNVISPNSPDPISAYYKLKHKQSYSSKKAASELTKALTESGQMIIACSNLDQGRPRTKDRSLVPQHKDWQPRHKNWISLNQTKRK